MARTADSQGQQGKKKDVRGEWLLESVKQTEAFVDQMIAAQAQAVARAEGAVDESARWAKESLRYGVELSKKWRDHAFAAARRAVDATAAGV